MAIDHPAAARLKQQFPQISLKGAAFRDQTQIAVPATNVLEVVRFLRDDPDLGYDMLSDVSCVDYLNYAGWTQERFGLVYIFNSVQKQSPRLIVRVFLNEPALDVPSVTGLFAGAEWLEREVYDMFGIRFTGHPDLRRILTWDGFKSHPLRKDYPVTGLGERTAYAVIDRESS